MEHIAFSYLAMYCNELSVNEIKQSRVGLVQLDPSKLDPCFDF